ncbi:MAG: hypothetical protein HY817_03680 [Candidatus Abawacabacteria bacterium]|nr:hypothetical protein [Candidatus Abawacabacteria bacterium]
MNFSQFFSLSYWFETTPIGDFRYLDLLTWVLIALFVLAIVIQLGSRFVAMHPVLRRFIRRLPGGLYITSIIGGFLVFARFQRAPYIGMRIWMLLTFVIFAAWLITLLVKFTMNYQREMGAFAKRKENKKKKRKLKS